MLKYLRNLDETLRLTIGAEGAVDEGTGGGGTPPPGGGGAGEGADPPAREPREREPRQAREPREPAPKRNIRQELEHQFKEARETPVEEPEVRDRRGRFKPGTQIGQRPAEEAEGAVGAEGAAPAAGEVTEAGDGTAAEAGDAPAVAAPEGWSKEAKEVWAELPPAVQAAVDKREKDMAKGVEQLKAKYVEMDEAVAPHIEAVRRHGHTPAQAVKQLFGWFQALGAEAAALQQGRITPEQAQAFPMLAKSFGVDITHFAPKPAASAAPAAGSAPAAGDGGAAVGEQPEAVSPVIQTYIDSMKAEMTGLRQLVDQRLGGLETNFAQQSQAKTNEVLAHWSQGKPHFEKVRGLMAQLVTSGIVPLKEGGIVDLDGAYERAIRLDPEVWATVQAEEHKKSQAAAAAKAAADKKRQDDEALKARRANVSLTGGAPGSSTPEGTQPQAKKGVSVRESINAAIAEHRQ